MTSLLDWLRERIAGLNGGASTGAPVPDRAASIDRVAPWLYIGPVLPAEGWSGLAERGVTHVLDLRAEADEDASAIEALGMRWRHVPIADRDAPDDAQLESIIDWLDDEADSSVDQAVYIHCHAGFGRTPTVAIALLMQQDLTLAEARRLVFAARPDVSPTTRQMAWLERLEARLRPPASADDASPDGE